MINTVDEIDGNDEKGKFIFVVSTEGIMYAGPKIRGKAKNIILIYNLRKFNKIYKKY